MANYEPHDYGPVKNVLLAIALWLTPIWIILAIAFWQAFDQAVNL